MEYTFNIQRIGEAQNTIYESALTKTQNYVV